jgi:deoxyadenosine/deoxycytidine kinase
MPSLKVHKKEDNYIMLKRHSKYFEELIFDRTEEIEQDIFSNNQRYRELSTEICEVQQALTDNLSPQLQSLVDRYYDAETEQDCIASETMYRQGLIDGIKLTGIMQKFFGKLLPS